MDVADDKLCLQEPVEKTRFTLSLDKYDYLGVNQLLIIT